jgi:hypothetical protein
MSKKKETNIDIFVRMLKKSTEDFRVYPVENETHVRFSDRKIIFVFKEDGSFTTILKSTKK